MSVSFRPSEIMLSYVDETVDQEQDKENGLYSLALNRRNSSRVENGETRQPFG